MNRCPRCEAGVVRHPCDARTWANVGSIVRLSAEQLGHLAKEPAKIIPSACDSCEFAMVALDFAP